jgi:sugar/nucleoside kinase (ribokinase family)
MSKLTVVGSIAFDAVETHAGSRDRMLGGSAVHFSLASSFFADTRVVGPVGDDFGAAEFAVMHGRGVNTDDIERVAGGRTFFWAGRYERDVNLRHTLQTDLNVFESFQPKLSEESRAADVLFLANIQPQLQIEVREQCPAARFTALDSMNLWIDIAREDLVRVIGMVDCVILNDGELKQLTDEPNLVRAARAVLALGPRVVVAKQGEYGAAMFTPEGYFALPAYPTEDVVDPTGAGDTFAGGFVGHIAAHLGEQELDDELLRRSLAYGTALASFNVEAFGTERVQTLTAGEVARRVAELEHITRFRDVPIPLRG